MMNETLARLMRAMINYNSGDIPRIQYFVKVHDFAATIGVAERLDEDNVFRSASAIEMLNDMWNLKYKQVTLNN